MIHIDRCLLSCWHLKHTIFGYSLPLAVAIFGCSLPLAVAIFDESLPLAVNLSSNLAFLSSADCNRCLSCRISAAVPSDTGMEEDDAAKIFCRLRGGDDELLSP